MSVIFKAGDRRYRMTFQTRSTSKGVLGGQSPTWTDAFTAWVSIDPLSGRERFLSQAVKSEVTHRIGTRYRSELSDPKAVAAMRGVYKGRFFDFQSVMNIEERNIDIEIMATEGLNNG